MASGHTNERYLKQYPSVDAWNWTEQSVEILHKILNSTGFTNTFLNVDWGLYTKNNISLEISTTVKHQQTDYTVVDGISKSNDSSLISMAPFAWGNYAADFTYNNVFPKKLFSCFIKRTEPIRQSWFYSFVRSDILHKGNISFWSENPQFNNLSPIELFEKYYQGFEFWEEEHKWIIQNLTLPFVNFDCTLEQAIVDTEKQLVIESVFEESDIVILSEKTFRALQLPRPFLLFTNSGSIDALRKIGFNVYDDFIDHSYDKCSNWIDRQQMILQQLENPIQYTHSMLEDFQQRAEHNHNILQELKNQWPEHLEHICKQVKKLDELC